MAENQLKEKYDALERTWMAANQQFIQFQEMAKRDLELAKSMMTAEQLIQWEDLRQENETVENVVTDGNERLETESDDKSGFRIITNASYQEMQIKVENLTKNVEILESLPVDEIKEHNNALRTDNYVLEEQLRVLNENFEKCNTEKTFLHSQIADIEEAMQDKIAEFEADTRLENACRELTALEIDFERMKEDVVHRMNSLGTVRKSRQDEIDEIVLENEFLVGRHRQNHREIHEKIKRRLKGVDVKNIVEELQAMLIEEKTAGEMRRKKLLDERIRLEDQIGDLRINAAVFERQSAENLQSSKQKQAEMENIRLRLDQETHARRNLEKMYEELRRELKSKRAEKKEVIKNLKEQIKNQS